MTIGGWIGFAIFAILIAMAGLFGVMECDSAIAKALSGIVAFILIFGLLIGILWYYGNTASGKRALIDQKIDINNGIERTITVYTADGNVIATYDGKIDIEANDGGYIKFDFDGKRYIYYNCFVESIAEIG